MMKGLWAITVAVACGYITGLFGPIPSQPWPSSLAEQLLGLHAPSPIRIEVEAVLAALTLFFPAVAIPITLVKMLRLIGFGRRLSAVRLRLHAGGMDLADIATGAVLPAALKRAINEINASSGLARSGAGRVDLPIDPFVLAVRSATRQSVLLGLVALIPPGLVVLGVFGVVAALLGPVLAAPASGTVEVWPVLIASIPFLCATLVAAVGLGIVNAVLAAWRDRQAALLEVELQALIVAIRDRAERARGLDLSRSLQEIAAALQAVLDRLPVAPAALDKGGSPLPGDDQRGDVPATRLRESADILAAATATLTAVLNHIQPMARPDAGTTPGDIPVPGIPVYAGSFPAPALISEIQALRGQWRQWRAADRQPGDPMG